MKLARFGALGAEKPGVLIGDERLDVSAHFSDYDEAFFAGGGVGQLRALLAAESARLPRVAPDARVGAPIARPSKLVCIGLNYRGHAKETGASIPKEPVVFMKATSAQCGPFDGLELPRGSEHTDFEVELALVIGKRARYVPRERALEHVAGYLLHNDYSERRDQKERGGQWVKGKSADTFAPMGPFLATPDEIDPFDTALWLRVNGEPMQSGSTSDLIFDVPTLIASVSEFMTLLPGDVISTGTPAGVGMARTPPRYLRPGDVVEYGATGLGSARQLVRAHHAR
ncbi:MAG TPA: fumarylacetoacetate hydrolase family protein [Polyangiaceae bacterium]|nr:fumarylacetoacetate hydrolase family protein [Polyangiaceae bacterium]